MKRQNALTLLTLSLFLGATAQATPLLTVDSVQLDTVVAPQDEETTLKGEIKTVDTDARSFTLVEGEKVHTVKFAADTKFTLDGKEVPAADALAKGRKVKITKVGDVIKSVAVKS